MIDQRRPALRSVAAARAAAAEQAHLSLHPAEVHGRQVGAHIRVVAVHGGLVANSNLPVVVGSPAEGGPARADACTLFARHGPAAGCSGDGAGLPHQHLTTPVMSVAHVWSARLELDSWMREGGDAPTPRGPMARASASTARASATRYRRKHAISCTNPARKPRVKAQMHKRPTPRDPAAGILPPRIFRYSRLYEGSRGLRCACCVPPSPLKFRARGLEGVQRGS